MKLSTLLPAILLIPFLSSTVAAQVCPIVVELNPNGTAFSSVPFGGLSTKPSLKSQPLTSMGGKYFFVATHPTLGRELFSTDGTPGARESSRISPRSNPTLAICR